MTTSQSSREQLDEATTVLRDSIVPAAKQQKGYAGYLLFANRDTGKGISITIWETEADREASGPPSEYYEEALSKVTPLLTDAPIVEDLELLIQD